MQNARILDIASGCGGLVFNGLKKGYDIWEIENEENRKLAGKNILTLLDASHILTPGRIRYISLWKRFLFKVTEKIKEKIKASPCIFSWVC